MNKTAQDDPTQTPYILNGKQRVILAVTAIVMVAMLLFPPFHRMNGDYEGMSLGNHFGMEEGFEQASVDKHMLLIQLATIFLVGAIGAMLFHSRNPEKPSQT